jgi:GntR family transcriptional regulator
VSIDLSKRGTIYVRIADDLRSKIASGQYRPGDRLPSRKELAQQNGVAPETVKKALDILEREGRVVTHSTRGTFVTEGPAEPEPSAGDVMERLAEFANRLDQLEGRINELEDRRG